MSQHIEDPVGLAAKCFVICKQTVVRHKLDVDYKFTMYTTWGGTSKNYDSAPRFYCESKSFYSRFFFSTAFYHYK